MSRRKGGIFEPEYRLWMALVPLVLHPAGCILFGVGANHGVHWMGIAFGLAFVVGTFPIGSAIAINYIIDSYREISGDGLVTMICIRNTVSIPLPRDCFIETISLSLYPLPPLFIRTAF
jgi:hypothetical protein